MPLVAALVVPHSPVLVPAIGKEHSRLVETTRRQVVSLWADVYARQPDIIVMLTPHGASLPGTVVLNVAERLTGELREFGDVATRLDAIGAVGFAHRLKEALEDQAVPAALQTVPQLDYGVTVPYSYAPPGFKQTKLLPIHIAGLDPQILIRLGQVMADMTQRVPDRVALVASADLARRPADDGSARWMKPLPEERRLAEAMSGVNVAQLVEHPMDESTCGQRPILTLLAAVAQRPVKGIIHSFEAPLRVGLMTASFPIT